MNPDLSSNLPPDSSFEEKTPKINLPPKPALVSSLSSQNRESSEAPPPLPLDSLETIETSPSATSFSISLPVVLAAFVAALLAFGLQLWLML